jgi:hypothetical protein
MEVDFTYTNILHSYKMLLVVKKQREHATAAPGSG